MEKNWLWNKTDEFHSTLNQRRQRSLTWSTGVSIMWFYFRDAEEEREVGGTDGAHSGCFQRPASEVVMTDGKRQEVPTGMWKCWVVYLIQGYIRIYNCQYSSNNTPRVLHFTVCKLYLILKMFTIKHKPKLSQDIGKWADWVVQIK